MRRRSHSPRLTLRQELRTRSIRSMVDRRRPIPRRSLSPIADTTASSTGVDRGNTESQRSMQILVDSVAPSSQASAIVPPGLMFGIRVLRGFPSTRRTTLQHCQHVLHARRWTTQTYAGTFNISRAAFTLSITGAWTWLAILKRKRHSLFESTATHPPPKSRPRNWRQWLVSRSGVVGLTATDPEDRRELHLCTDGGLTIIYSAPFTVSGEGQHTVLYWSNDKLTHTERRTAPRSE